MARNIGLWIDHKQIYIIDYENQNVQVIPSNIEPRVHAGGTRIGGLYNQGQDSELGHNDRYQRQLHEFYESVIAATQDAERLFVMGPNMSSKKPCANIKTCAGGCSKTKQPIK